MHGNRCTLIPIGGSKDKLSSFIIPIVLDIDFDKFTSIDYNCNYSDEEKAKDMANSDTFLEQLPKVLDIDGNVSVVMNGICVTKGSSIVWIKQ